VKSMVGAPGVSQTLYFNALVQRCGRKGRFDAQKIILTLPAPYLWRPRISRQKSQRAESCKALCRDGQGRALGPLGAALDAIAGSAP
jgi:hypothetical protein